MDKNEIIKILEDWNFWKTDQDLGLIREHYLDRLEGFLKSNQVIVITGPRRSGKSFIMRQFARSLIEKGISRSNILIINFEDPRFPSLDAKSLNRVFEIYLESLNPSGELYIFLDEIQEVKGWEKWVCTMQELKKARMIVSGSNAKLLSKELATVLTGRHLDLSVFPLSFKEYLHFNQLKLADNLDLLRQEVKIRGLFRKYLEEGAYPEVVLSAKKKEILLAYFDDIINKDIIHRYRIRKGEKLKSLAKYYLCQMASLVTYNSSAKVAEISTDTAEKFSGYLETAYLVTLLRRFSFKLKEQEKSPRKLYAVDTGLANAIGFRFTENWGRLAENVIWQELQRRQAEEQDLELYYWKDVHHREVDFILKKGLKVECLIQVSWETEAAKTKEREMRSLLKAMKEFDLSESRIITEDQEAEENIQGKRIVFIPLWKWLLNIT